MGGAENNGVTLHIGLTVTFSTLNKIEKATSVNFSETHQLVTAHAMKCYRRSAIQLLSFITSVLDGGVTSVSRSRRLTPRGRTPVSIVQKAGWASELE